MEHPENDKKYRGLTVNVGVEQPASVNPYFTRRRPRRDLTVAQYVEGIRKGDITVLSQAVTLVESMKHEHQVVAQEVIEKCLPFAGQSVRIGISGVPGAGKSTSIDVFGLHVLSEGGKLAVLAIDPSSERSKGSILGDKTRMEKLSVHPNSFIRPSPSAGSLGGVARKTRETIILCEAAGFDKIFVETVGVGQSEAAVRSMVDFFLLMVITGAGDELQGIKKGVMELADAILINKADGANIQKANMTRAEYDRILHYLRPATEGWTTKAYTCSAADGTGISEIWGIVGEFMANVKASGMFAERRKQQTLSWVYAMVEDYLKQQFYGSEAVISQQPSIEKKVVNGELSATEAAGELIRLFENE